MPKQRRVKTPRRRSPSNSSETRCSVNTPPQRHSRSRKRRDKQSNKHQSRHYKSGLRSPKSSRVRGRSPSSSSGEHVHIPKRRSRPPIFGVRHRASYNLITSKQTLRFIAPLTLTFDTDLDDDVFVCPRTDNGNDPFSTTNLEIFSYTSPRTPAGLLLSPRRDRKFTFSVSSEKHWRDKGGTDVADGVTADIDETDAASDQENVGTSEGSLLSSILPNKLSGSICTAVLLVVGWKLLSTKR